MKKLHALLLMLVLSVASFGVDKTELQKSMVTISQSREFDEECTAYTVAPKVILTAKHCLSRHDIISVNGKWRKIEKLVYENADSVSVTVDGDSFEHTALISHRTLIQGERLYTWGNPQGLTNIYREGYVMGYFTPNKAYMLNMQTLPGDSGSALFDEAGFIVGVLSGSLFVNDVPTTFSYAYGFGKKGTK